MFGRFSVYPSFCFLFGSCCFFLKNTKIPKIFSLFPLVCFFGLVCLKRKIQKYFALFGLLFSLFGFSLFACFLKSKTPKIFVVLLWFCEFFAVFSRPQWILVSC